MHTFIVRVPSCPRSPVRVFSRHAILVRRWALRVLGEAERAGLRRIEKGSSPADVGFGHEDFDGSKAVERQTMGVSQRLAALHGWDARGFKKGPDLPRVNFTVRDKHALHLLIHAAPPNPARRREIGRDKTSILHSVSKVKALLQHPRFGRKKQRDHLLMVIGGDDDDQRVPIGASRVTDRFLRAHASAQ